MIAAASGPLAGVRIVDLTTNLSGPFATMVLAQQGADVIKVERPPGGDILRRVGSGRGGTSAYFVNTNWGKRSIALDLDNANDRETMDRLIARADVLVENFREGVMAGLGFAPDDLLAQHPRLIYAAVRGYPAGSVLAETPAYDHVIQALTGFADTQADLKTNQPFLVQQALVDKVTGLTAAQAVTAALYERHRTGRGRYLEIPMVHAALSFLWPDVTTHVSILGEFEKLPPQSRTFRLTETADGYIAMITVSTPQWDGLLSAVGLDDLVGSPDLDTPQKRGRNARGLMKEIASRLTSLSADEAVRRLREHGVPCARVASLEELPAVIEEISPGYLVREHHPELGDMIHPGPAVRFDDEVEIRHAPSVGEHTKEILAELDEA